MAAFNLRTSLERAGPRLASRAQRSDRGRSRLPEPVQRELHRLLSDRDRPPMRNVLASLRAFCRRKGYPVPARATVYAFLSIAPTPRYRASELPASVRATLHNVDPAASVPGPQLVQRAFDAGDIAAISFASTLPWLCLYQAAEMRGFRPKSRALLRAIMRTRRI